MNSIEILECFFIIKCPLSEASLVWNQHCLRSAFTLRNGFFFIIWPFSWVSLVCNQRCLRSAFIFRNGFFLHHMAFLLGQLSLESALFEISIHIQEWFFFIIWPFSWVSLVCNQLCFCLISYGSAVRDQICLRSALSEISSV